MSEENARQKLIFLDMDGVLNGSHVYEWDLMPKPLIVRQSVLCLNLIIESTSAALVLSSSWRYMIHGGSMTVYGFEHMLRTHGVRGRLIGVTREDKEDEPRAAQISHWLNTSTMPHGNYVVLDDDIDAGHGHPFVQTNPAHGLTSADADKAIKILNQA